MCIIYTHDVCDILSSTQRNIFQIQPSFFSPTIVVTDASHASCEANWDGFTKMDTMASNPKHELVAYSRWKTHEVRRSHSFNSVPCNPIHHMRILSNSQTLILFSVTAFKSGP